ncbi:MAG: hypothetical protein FJ290_28860 [Planctomycetes bacterium]|nr:hypothetical protein [Planctomycetota bacterium]
MMGFSILLDPADVVRVESSKSELGREYCLVYLRSGNASAPIVPVLVEGGKEQLEAEIRKALERREAEEAG